jgi:hypothetical protein
MAKEIHFFFNLFFLKCTLFNIQIGVKRNVWNLGGKLLGKWLVGKLT